MAGIGNGVPYGQPQPPPQQAPPQNGAAAPSQMFTHPVPGPQVMPTGMIAPSFPDIASTLDYHARRIPWWVWLGAGVYVGSKFLK
jgi:hypothetical protein